MKEKAEIGKADSSPIILMMDFHLNDSFSHGLVDL